MHRSPSAPFSPFCLKWRLACKHQFLHSLGWDQSTRAHQAEMTVDKRSLPSSMWARFPWQVSTLCLDSIVSPPWLVSFILTRQSYIPATIHLRNTPRVLARFGTKHKQIWEKKRRSNKEQQDPPFIFLIYSYWEDCKYTHTSDTDQQMIDLPINTPCNTSFSPPPLFLFNQNKVQRTDYAAVQAECENLSRNELTPNLSGNIQPQSSQLAEPLWTDPGIKSAFSVHELISTSKKKKKKRKKKKAQSGNEWSNFLPKSSQTMKKPPPHSKN